MTGPKRTRADRRPITAREPSKMAADLRYPSYGRFLAITMRWTWFVPS
ncbi:hypothetical protein BX283_3654 [Streptomyces sp. TLI_146]|nr:hypothetical protein BX283_3654 [Streptomyces sp. TLI_146]